MAYRKIQVNAPFFSNVEDESRPEILAESRRDVIKDALGATVKRPGLSVFSDELPGVIQGQFYWKHTDLVYIVCDKGLYSLSKTGVVVLIASGLLENSQNVVWSESSDFTLVTAGAVKKLFLTNGGRIVEYDGATAQKLSDSDAPINASHIIMFDSYMLSNDLSDPKLEESIKLSKVADPINFEGAFFSAENKSDAINAIHRGWDEIAIFGSGSIENFYNNGVAPFVPIPGGNIESGTLSPWTIKLAGNSYFYLDSDRKVIRLAGRQPIEVSQAIDNLLDGDVDYKGAEGDVLTIGSNKLYLLTINDRTFVFDYQTNEWVGEWGFWDKNTATYQRFKARNFLNIKQWGKTLCTDKSTGTVYDIDFGVYQDADDEIRSSIITGNIDHGTGRLKRSNELRLRLKRGTISQTAVEQIAPRLLIRWRDNGKRDWSNWREVDLGFAGDTKFYYSLYQLGSYQSRQYEFICSDDTPFSIIEVEEDVTLLR